MAQRRRFLLDEFSPSFHAAAGRWFVCVRTDQITCVSGFIKKNEEEDAAAAHTIDERKAF